MTATSEGMFLLEDQKQARRDGKLTGWKCATCGFTRSTPMFVCPKDRSRKIVSVELPNEGKVVSFTIQKISSEEFLNDLPFAFVVVELTNGVHVTGWVADISRDADLPLGSKVRYTPSYKPGVQFEKS
ncbi:MAG: Zn-ribbon domain-containing OB-fold protein [Thermoplasmatota archaeon]